MYSPTNRYNLSPPLEHLSLNTSASEDGSCHLYNANSFRSISNLSVNDTTYYLHIIHSDINLDRKSPVFVYEKTNELHLLMGCALTRHSDCQRTLYGEDDCFKKDRICVLIPSWVREAKIHHTVHAEVICFDINCNPEMSNVPDNTPTCLKNPLDVSERILSLAGLQADLHVCDRFKVDISTSERELVFVLQRSEMIIYRNAFLMNSVDTGQSLSDVLPDYLQGIYIKTNTNISSLNRLLENCSSVLHVKYVPDSGSWKAHIVTNISYMPEVSTSGNCVQSEGYNMLGVRLDVVNDYQNGIIQDRILKIIRKSDFSVTEQRKLLKVLKTTQSALPAVLYMPLYNSHINCFNTFYSWQEAYKNQMLETRNALCKSSHNHTTIVKNSNSSTFHQRSSPGDFISFNESNRHINSFETFGPFDDIRVIYEDSTPLQSSVVAHEDTVRAGSGVSPSSWCFHSVRGKPSNLEMQMKLKAADSVQDICHSTRDSSDSTGNDFTKHPIIKCQEIRSLSQPSLPTYFFHDSTDDEQCSENSDYESGCLSDIFRTYEDINQENISEFLATTGKNKHMEMPYNAITIVADETAEYNQNVYTLQSDHLSDTTVTEYESDIPLTELHNKSQMWFVEDDKLRNREGRKVSYSLSPEVDTDNDHEVPCGFTEDTNILEVEHRNNSVQVASGINQNIIVIERECPIIDKENIIIPPSHNQVVRNHKGILERRVQCNMYNQPGVADSWSCSDSKICSEVAETGVLSECSSNCTIGADIQCNACVVTWAGGSHEYKVQKEIITTQMHKAHKETCCFIVAHNGTDNRCESCTVKGSISNRECIIVKESRIVTPYLPSITCSTSNNVSHQHMPEPNNIVFHNLCPECIPSSCENSCSQQEPGSCPCVKNIHSHNQIPQVHDKSLKDALNSCMDIAIHKYKNDMPRQSCYTEVKPTKDVAIQTNIRSLTSVGNQNGCFVCFSNNHCNSDGFKTVTHRNLASKRNFEALALESVSSHKKPRYDTLKSMYLESGISQLPARLNSGSEKLETTDDNNNEGSDFQNVELLDELQDNIVMYRQNSVDQTVPDVGKDISWMENDLIEKELYVRDQFIKAPFKPERIFEWHKQYQIQNTTDKAKETAHQSHSSVKRSIRVGLSRRAQPLPLHPRYPQQ